MQQRTGVTEEGKTLRKTRGGGVKNSPRLEVATNVLAIDAESGYADRLAAALRREVKAREKQFLWLRWKRGALVNCSIRLSRNRPQAHATASGKAGKGITRVSWGLPAHN